MTELRARGLSSVRPGETREFIQALRDENARLRALLMPRPRVPQVPHADRGSGGGGGGVSGGGSGNGDGGGNGLALFVTVPARGDSREAAEAALGGVLDGMAYPCSPDARTYCDGEVELEHEIKLEVGAVGGAPRLPRRYPPQDTPKTPVPRR